MKIEAEAPTGLDRGQLLARARAHLTELIACDTRNPPGNELVAARYLDEVFSKIPGTTRHLLPVGDGRANFIARLKAPAATRPPVLVMGHMDVVGVEEDRWATPPLVAAVVDEGGEEYIHGRGAIDDKGMLSTALAAIQALAPRRNELDRDVIFLATAGEEGGPRVGMEEVINKHLDLLGNAEFAINEGGRVRIRDGRIVSVNIQTTEKVPYAVLVNASGTGGHASVPLVDNALAALSRAVARVDAWQAPVVLNETTRLYFAGLAAMEPDPERSRAMREISAPGASDAVVNEAARVLSRDPLHNAVLRSGQSLTIMSGGQVVNVIPSEAQATFNVRVMPDDDIEELVRIFNKVAAEPRVVFSLRGEPRAAPPVSPVGSSLYKAMESAARVMAPSAAVIPFMSTGATDGALLRAAGVPTYGILPMPLSEGDELRMHGHDERVPVSSLAWAAEYLYRTLDEVAGPTAG